MADAGAPAGSPEGGLGGLAAIARHVDGPDAPAAETTARSLAARARLGALAEHAAWLSAVQGSSPPVRPDRVRLVLLGAAAATGPVLAAAARGGIGVRAVPVLDEQPLAAGVAFADAEVDSGAELLVLAVPESAVPVAAAVLVAALTDTEPVRVIRTGLETSAWIEAVREVRERRRRAMPLRHEPDRLLAEVGTGIEAAAAGLLLQAAQRRTPVVVDGLSAVAAALVAHGAAPQAHRWWQLADTSGEPAHQLASTRLGLTPILRLDTSTGDGTAGVLAVEVLRAAADSAAVGVESPEPSTQGAAPAASSADV
jgi:nicotinate-nucleotide--dimethylbenzimidazole phosphoribosyltransferase